MRLKYAEIIKYVEQRIAEGQLRPGSRLPSIRTLSELFSCSNNSVIKAYSELEKKHIIYSIAKSGYYVVDGYLSQKIEHSELVKIDFLSAGPDKKIMPFRDYQHCINQAIEIYKEEMFTYSETQGLSSLRAELTRHLQELQVFTVPERICVVSGSQQALHLLVSLPFPNGKSHICVEQPTHIGLIESIRLQQVKTFGMEVTSKGINLEQLESLFKHQDIKFFYTVSRFHNPTGYSYTNEEKQKIVRLAQKYDVYIIEDDYMGDFDANMKQDPMFAYDPSGRVIYTKSFSKVLLPGMRLGLTILPESLIAPFLRSKFATDLHTPVLTQGALQIYLKSGMFKAHIQQMRSTYRHKATLLQKAYKKYLPSSVTYSGSLSGFYSTITLPSQLKSVHFIEHMKKEHVYMDEVEKMYLPEFKKETMIRLSISQVEDDLIDLGVHKIASGISKLLTQQP